MNLLGAAAAVLSLCAFACSYRLLRHQTWPRRLVAFAAFGLLALPALLVGVFYLHWLPEWAWFYEMRSWRGSEFLVLFLGAACGAGATLLPRILLVVPLFGLLGTALAPYLKPLLSPLKEGLIQERWAGQACVQSTGSTCGPASTCTVLRQIGIFATEPQLAQAAWSYTGGTEAWYLARCVRDRGGRATFDFRKDFSVTVALPAVVGVRLGDGVGHFIAVLEVKEGMVTFADPLIGQEVLSLSDFRNRYAFTGFHMAVAKAQK